MGTVLESREATAVMQFHAVSAEQLATEPLPGRCALLRMADAPMVETHILPSTLTPSGAGEMGIPSAAPALANAIYSATGERLRRLPLLRV